MADYYLDGTISSVSGTGSGTELDPWGKDSDLLAYAVAEVASGAGIDSDGDSFIVLDGDLNSTAMLNLAGYSFTKPFTVRPFVMDGTQRVTYDLGDFAFHNSTSISGIGIYFLDFENIPTASLSGSGAGAVIDFNGRGNFIGCSIDGTGGSASTWLSPGLGSNVVGNHFKNDQRTAGLLINGAGNANLISGNYFENITGDFYDIYTYASAFTNNVLTYDPSYTYSSGSVLPIDAGKIRNNTFVGPGSGGGTAAAAAILVTNSYEVNHIENNYFEGFALVLNLTGSSTSAYLLNQVIGNRYHNCTDFFETGTPSEAVILNQENLELSESGLVDVAGGDYRPNNLLINQGYNPFAMTNALNNTLRPTIGALENNIVVPRVRDIY